MQKETIGVNGMSCGHCEIAVQDAIRKQPGIKKAKANRRKKQVTVEYDPDLVTLDQIKASVSEVGYEVEG